MKTKITKKSVSLINKMIVESYYNIYENLRRGLEEKKYRVSEETIARERAENWQFSQKFMPQKIQDIIRKEYLRCFSIDIRFEEHITFSVRWFVRTDKNLTSKLQEKLLRALATMIIMSRFSSCSLKNKNIVLHMFDTNVKKFFPDEGQKIGPEHVNSAYTFACRNSKSPELEIVIYREEEWQKVLFHELMHTYSLDIGMDTAFMKRRLSNIFNGLDCNFNLTEAYCEFWARTIWTAVISKGNVKQQISLLDKQQEWAIRQASNVLVRMSQRLKSCYESTSAFSYYVITGLLLSAFPSTVEWCEQNCSQLLDFPKTQQGVTRFLQFINNIVEDEAIHAKWTKILEQHVSNIGSTAAVTSKMSYV